MSTGTRQRFRQIVFIPRGTPTAAMPDAPAVSWQRFRALGAVTALYACALLTTAARHIADTTVYVHDILLFDKGSFEHYPNPIWEFGHLYWRPIGWVLFKWFGGLTPFAASGLEKLVATTVLFSFTMLCGFVCALLFYSMASALLGHRWKALLVTAGMLGCYSFLNYVQSGAPYIPGLMGLLGALWAVIRAVDSGKFSWQYGLLSGALFAFSVLMWLPYIVVLPGILAAAIFWGKPGAAPMQRRVRLASWVFFSAAGLTALGYLAVILQLKFLSFAEMQAWMLASSHGWSQNKRLLRMVSGLPRSFLYNGEGGMALKRYLLKDPYAPVTLGDLIRQHLWAPMIFYTFALCLIGVLWRSLDGRRVLWICLAATIPALAFAAFVFESGSLERYLPLYPFICLAIAHGLSQLPTKTAAPVVILAFVLLAIAVNGSSLSKSRIDAEIAPSVARLESLRGKVTSEGLVVLTAIPDSLYWLLTIYPFHPANRGETIVPYDVIQTANERIVRWQPDFAKRALDTLSRSQSVWVSKRLLADRPEPAWGWTEGDDPHISWKKLPAFFRQFSYSESVGGADGFLKLEPENKTKLEAVAVGI
ncbi:MAG TPA: glycosyltransferase family 39 protein [Bryobacteraceae bacterium]